jgi:hypothetical protein
MVDHDLLLAKQEAKATEMNHLATPKARWGSI